MDSVVYTGGLDVSAQAASDIFDFDDSFANYTFDGSRIVPSHPDLGLDKERIAQRYLCERDLELQDCLVVGNSDTDMPLMRLARLSLASPLADEEIRQVADLWAENYGNLARDLRSF
jgi:phosphoserine phosphatase